MDISKFMSEQFEARTQEVKIDELNDYFDGEPIFTVRGLSFKELSLCDQQSESNATEALIKAISGNLSEKEEAIKKIAGIDNDLPAESKKRIHMLKMGCVNPKIDDSFAVKFAHNFPIPFTQLTNTIAALTGQGAQVMEKRKPSTKKKK